MRRWTPATHCRAGCGRPLTPDTSADGYCRDCHYRLTWGHFCTAVGTVPMRTQGCRRTTRVGMWGSERRRAD